MNQPSSITISNDQVVHILLHAATREDISRLDAKIDTKFDILDAKIDTKFDILDAKIGGLDAKIDAKIDKLWYGILISILAPIITTIVFHYLK